jgi:hypothetical protein
MDIIINDEDELVAKVIAVCMIPFLIPASLAVMTMEGIWNFYEKICERL